MHFETFKIDKIAAENMTVEFYKAPDSKGKSKLLGSSILTLSSMGFQKQYDINRKKAIKGKLMLSEFDIHPKYTFLDYIIGGCRLNFTFAIDFTAENGKVQNPRSLHNYQEEEYNECLNSIKMMGNILQNYSGKETISMVGFGAITPPKIIKVAGEKRNWVR